MSYYDSTVAHYDNCIQEKRNLIIECTNKIKELEADLEQLEQTKKLIKEGVIAIKTASNNTANRILKAPELTNPFSILKINWFDNFLDAVRGTSFDGAIGSMDYSLKKISERIDSINEEIDSLKKNIILAEASIATLKFQRTMYIEEATKPVVMPVATTPEMEAIGAVVKTKTKSSSAKKK